MSEGQRYANGMRSRGLLGPIVFLLLTAAIHASGAVLASCGNGTRLFSPCEITFDEKPGDLPAATNPYTDEVLTVEFRSPHHDTYLIRGFDAADGKLHVRFTPTQPGMWTYHVVSLIKALDGREASVNVADDANPGFVSVANLRHWWTANKQPHLWLSAAISFQTPPPSLEQWLDKRKAEGFTHVRGTLLSDSAKSHPFSADGLPARSYFDELDDRVLSITSRGLTADLILSDESLSKLDVFADEKKLDSLLRYLVARYGSLNVTWQGLAHFESVPNGRVLLRQIASSLQKYDVYHHPLSSDASVTSGVLIPDGWMSYVVESSPHTELGAVEHQFMQVPSIHVVQATEPAAFRRELWESTMNGELPTIPSEALENDANLGAVRTWKKVVADTRYWELEPYFDVDGAQALGLNEVEYLAYAPEPGNVEVTTPRHKYNPIWVNPISGEETVLKNYKGEVFSQSTPDNQHDWVLQVPREGHKEGMLRSVKFESEPAPVQEVEYDTVKIPFELVEPKSAALQVGNGTHYAVRVTKRARSTRIMRYVWIGEVVSGGEAPRVVGLGPSGALHLPPDLYKSLPATLNMRLLAINALGKAYEIDRVYSLTP